MRMRRDNIYLGFVFRERNIYSRVVLFKNTADTRSTVFWKLEYIFQLLCDKQNFAKTHAPFVNLRS